MKLNALLFSLVLGAGVSLGTGVAFAQEEQPVNECTVADDELEAAKSEFNSVKLDVAGQVALSFAGMTPDEIANEFNVSQGDFDSIVAAFSDRQLTQDEISELRGILDNVNLSADNQALVTNLFNSADIFINAQVNRNSVCDDTFTQPGIDVDTGDVPTTPSTDETTTPPVESETPAETTTPEVIVVPTEDDDSEADTSGDQVTEVPEGSVDTGSA